CELARNLSAGLQHRAVLQPVMEGRLWSDPELRKNRNTSANNRPHGLRKFRCGVQLDHISARLLDDGNGCSESLIHTFLKSAERKSTADQAAFRTASDRLTNNNHLFQSDLQRILMTPEVNSHR